MNKSYFLNHKTGFLTALIIALFAVAALLLGRAGYLGSGGNLTGDLTAHQIAKPKIAVAKLIDNVLPNIKIVTPATTGTLTVSTNTKYDGSYDIYSANDASNSNSLGNGSGLSPKSFILPAPPIPADTPNHDPAYVKSGTGATYKIAFHDVDGFVTPAVVSTEIWANANNSPVTGNYVRDCLVNIADRCTAKMDEAAQKACATTGRPTGKCNTTQALIGPDANGKFSCQTPTSCDSGQTFSCVDNSCLTIPTTTGNLTITTNQKYGSYTLYATDGTIMKGPALPALPIPAGVDPAYVQSGTGTTYKIVFGDVDGYTTPEAIKTEIWATANNSPITGDYHPVCQGSKDRTECGTHKALIGPDANGKYECQVPMFCDNEPAFKFSCVDNSSCQPARAAK